MLFSDVLSALKDGKAIRRKRWMAGVYVVYQYKSFYQYWPDQRGEASPYTFGPNEIMADDWIICDV